MTQGRLARDQEVFVERRTCTCEPKKVVRCGARRAIVVGQPAGLYHQPTCDPVSLTHHRRSVESEVGKATGCGLGMATAPVTGRPRVHVDLLKLDGGTGRSQIPFSHGPHSYNHQSTIQIFLFHIYHFYSSVIIWMINKVPAGDMRGDIQVY